MDRLFLTPIEISRTISEIGKRKATETVFELFIFGILAGMYIAFGASAATAILSGSHLDPGLSRFIAASVFTVGLMLVLIPGSELFTGNILMTIGFIYKEYSLMKVLRNWFVVYIGNLIGAILIAWLVLKSGLLTHSGDITPVGETAVNIAQTKLGLSFVEAFSRGILCNMLVCLAVIMSIAARTITGKIFAIYFPIMTFVVSGYEHSVANMYFLPAGLMVKGEFISDFLVMFNNLVPVTIGNIIGGLLIVFLHPKVEERIARILMRKKHL
ncbi:MAG: formate/nitrite transporter family protein [Candidatus Omnitrophota bacterium]